MADPEHSDEWLKLTRNVLRNTVAVAIVSVVLAVTFAIVGVSSPLAALWGFVAGITTTVAAIVVILSESERRTMRSRRLDRLRGIAERDGPLISLIQTVFTVVAVFVGVIGIVIALVR